MIELEDTFEAIVPTRFVPGNKVYLPDSVLEELQDELEFPLTFRVANPRTLKQTYCGVQEFTALPGRAVLTTTVAKNLGAVEGDTLYFELVKLGPAASVRLKPYHNSFYRIDDPVRDLEREVGKFTCLVEGDRIFIEFAGQQHELLVEKLEPSAVGLVLDVDLRVDFAPSFENEEKEKLAEKAKPEAEAVPTQSVSKGVKYSLTSDSEPVSVAPTRKSRFDGKVVSEVRDGKKYTYWEFEGGRRLFEIGEVLRPGEKKYSLI